MAFDGEYVFAAALTQALKGDIQTRIHTQLTEMLGVEVDTTMAEYVVTMVGNKKSMTQIASDLVDFIGDEHAQLFVQWLHGMLATLEDDDGNATADTNEDVELDQDDADELAPPSEDAASETTQPAKRVISLKSVTSSSAPAPQKKVISLGGSSSGTIRTLNKEGNDMRDMLARRSQRFGIPEKKPAASPQRGRDGNKREDKTKDSSDARGNKRKADGNDAQQKRPGSASGRLSQLLGPPVNVDQAELDARDSLQTSKRKKTGREDRDSRGSRNDQENQRDAEGNNRRQNRRRGDDDQDKSQPPLPPGSQDGGRSDRSDRSDRPGRNDRDGRDGGRNDPRNNFYPPDNFRGPPGYGGFAPPPYGHPMGFYPPPYGMPPYGMGFPPQGMPPGPYMQPPMPPGPPKSHFQPRGPRAFQNKTWVNPNAPKPETAEGGEEAAASADGAAPTGGAPMNPKATTFMPRNPYFSSQMRPRFQNKTWVRPDPAKEEELSSSLPQTPPREEMESVPQE